MAQGGNSTLILAQNLREERAAPLDHLPQGDGSVAGLLVRYRMRMKLSMAYDLGQPAYPIWTVAPLTALAVCGLHAPSLKRMVSYRSSGGGTFIGQQGKMG